LPRRSAQTALHHILHSLTTLIAPILSFTAEEIWETLHPGQEESIFSGENYLLPSVAHADALLLRWAEIRNLRADVLKQIEAERAGGRVGSSLQAEVVVNATAGEAALLETLGDELRFVFITSAATVATTAPKGIVVTPSAQQKCERCWHYRADVGSHPDHLTICGRCVSNLDGMGEARSYA
jgi:isoleucyl-tRNA synthetase